MKESYSKIVATGSYLPEGRLLNDELSGRIKFDEKGERIKLTEEDILKRTGGIRERRIAGLDETNATLGVRALENLLESGMLYGFSPIDPSVIDYLITATNTNKENFPAAAAEMQAALNIKKKIPFLDLQAGCTSFNYALEIADALIAGGNYETIAVVGTDTLSKIVDYSSKDSMLFGDGAGAVLLQRSKNPGLIKTESSGNGSRRDLLKMAEGYMRMQGRRIFRFAVDTIVDSCSLVLNKAGYSLRDVNWVLPHQANGRILDEATQRLAALGELGRDELKSKVLRNIEYYGNTSTASVPILLNEFIKKEKIKEGDIVLMVAFGAGLTACANLVRV